MLLKYVGQIFIHTSIDTSTIPIIYHYIYTHSLSLSLCPYVYTYICVIHIYVYIQVFFKKNVPLYPQSFPVRSRCFSFPVLLHPLPERSSSHSCSAIRRPVALRSSLRSSRGIPWCRRVQGELWMV